MLFSTPFVVVAFVIRKAGGIRFTAAAIVVLVYVLVYDLVYVFVYVFLLDSKIVISSDRGREKIVMDLWRTRLRWRRIL